MTTLLGGRRWISLSVAFAMVVAAMAIGIPSADAAKPAYDRDFYVTDVQLVALPDGTCVAKVWWEGLKGGRKINVQFDLRADVMGTPEHNDGLFSTLRAQKETLEVQRGLTGEMKHTGYAEHAFSFPYDGGILSGEGYYHLQVAIFDRNGSYGDFGGTSPDGDMSYDTWEYGNNMATYCTAP